jgi:hypothetical protein
MSLRPTKLVLGLKTPTFSNSVFTRQTHLHLHFYNIFGGSFFGNNDEGNNDSDSNNYRDDDDSCENIGTSNIFKMKVKNLKVGGCRLYLSLYLIGEINNPEKHTWKMDQTGDGGIDLYYRDASGALMILFEDDSIIVNRLGSAPSMNYLMHESSVLTGMLDQLDDIAFDSSIDEKDRLLTLHEPGDAINIVRESLSFT